MATTRGLAERLERAQEAGVVTDWYSYSPGDNRGTRWVVWGPGYNRTFTTAEAEAFLDGIEAGR